MKFILFFFCLLAIYTSARLKKWGGANTFIKNDADSTANSGAINSGIGAATSVALSMANNVNVATNVNTNFKMGDINVRGI
jgi:hypothetical protein